MSEIKRFKYKHQHLEKTGTNKLLMTKEEVSQLHSSIIELENKIEELNNTIMEQASVINGLRQLNTTLHRQKNPTSIVAHLNGGVFDDST